jgi:spore coat protein CotF
MPNGDGLTLDNRIATLLDQNLKSGAPRLVTSACECTTPELRRAFMKMSQHAVLRQEELARLMHEKGYYVAPAVEEDTLIQLRPQLKAALAGISVLEPGANDDFGNMNALRV